MTKKNRFENVPEKVLEVYNDTVGFVKEMMGICNNAAWLISLDAYDELKKLHNWKSKVKGGRTVAEGFKRVFDEYHRYERALIYDTKYGLFDVNNFTEDARRKYGEHVTNRDCYDYWASTGATTYARMRPLVTSLQNKFRLSLEHAGINKETDIKAWGLTAYNCINMAVSIYGETVRVASDMLRINPSKLSIAFGMFSLQNVMKLWGDACEDAFPDASFAKFSELDKKNVYIGLTQIGESWSEGKQIFGDMKRATIETGEDVFRTKGFMLKEAEKIQENIDDWEKEKD